MTTLLEVKEDFSIHNGKQVIVDAYQAWSYHCLILGKLSSGLSTIGTDVPVIGTRDLMDPRLRDQLPGILESSKNDIVVEYTKTSQLMIPGTTIRDKIYGVVSPKNGKRKSGDGIGVDKVTRAHWLVDGITPARQSTSEQDTLLFDNDPADVFATDVVTSIMTDINQEHPDGITPNNIRTLLRSRILSLAQDKITQIGLPSDSWGDQATCPAATMTYVVPQTAKNKLPYALQVGDIPLNSITSDGKLVDLTDKRNVQFSRFASRRHDVGYGRMARLGQKLGIDRDHSINLLRKRYAIKVGAKDNQIQKIPITNDPELFDALFPENAMRVMTIPDNTVATVTNSDGFASDNITSVFLALTYACSELGLLPDLGRYLGSDFGAKPDITRIIMSLSRYIAYNTPDHFERFHGSADDDASFLLNYRRDLHPSADNLTKTVFGGVWMQAMTQVVDDLERVKALPSLGEYEDALFLKIHGAVCRLLEEEMRKSKITIDNEVRQFMANYAFNLIGQIELDMNKEYFDR